MQPPSPVVPKQLHLVPVDDLIAHDKCDDCVCLPDIYPCREISDPDNLHPALLYVHSALDGREDPRSQFI